MHCFERAGRHREVAVANAYSLREGAQKMTSAHRHDKDPAAAFLAAAEAFMECAVAATREKRAYYRIAAECFVKHGNNYKAAKAYLDAEEYTLAAQLYRKDGHFDDAVHIITAHRDKMLSNVVESILDVARLVYLRDSKQE
jgi:hypothetical protein